MSYKPTGKRDDSKCGDNKGTAPTSFLLKDLIDLDVDEKTYSHTGCTAAGPTGYNEAWSKGYRFPDNGEFEYWQHGDRSCRQSGWTWRYGCETPSGSGGVIGRRPGVKRNAFLGDKANCCLNATAIDEENGTTCDPKFRHGSSTECALILPQLCKNGDNLFTKTGCNQWRNNNKADAKNVVKTYCNQNKVLSHEGCREWAHNNINDLRTEVINYCKSGGKADSKECKDIYGVLGRKGVNTIMENHCVNNFGEKICRDWALTNDSTYKRNKIDGMVRNYCKQHPDDDFCKCQNVQASADQIRRGYSNPRCFAVECVSPSSYLPGKFTNNCPPVITCEQAINVQNNQALDGINLSNISQSCIVNSKSKEVIADSNQKVNTDGNVNKDGGSANIDASATGDKDKSEKNRNLMIIVIIIIVVIIIGATVAIGGGLAYYYKYVKK